MSEYNESGEYNESVNWSELNESVNWSELYYQPGGSNTESYITTENCMDMMKNELPDHLLNQIQELKIIIILLILIIIFLIKDNIITEIKRIIKNKFLFKLSFCAVLRNAIVWYNPEP